MIAVALEANEAAAAYNHAAKKWHQKLYGVE